MKMKHNLLKLIFFFLPTFASAQPDTLNQFDSTGLKNGWWVDYLNSNLGEINDAKTDTVYYRYTFYDHGFNLVKMGSIGTKKYTIATPMNLVPDHTGFILLDGEFISLDKNVTTRFLLNANKGHLTVYEEYYESGKMSHFFDYTKLWKGVAHTFYSCGYNKDGVLTWDMYFHKGGFKNGKEVWMLWND